MRAYLSSVDLWLIVSAATARPAQAGEAQTNWDTADARAIGIISLTLADHVFRKVRSLVNAAQPIEAAQLSHLWWTQIETHYGTISPSQVFDLIKQAINFRLDGSSHPRPQLERLEAIHADLATNQAELPEFVRSMILLSRLPPAWETSIIQTVMAGGQVTGITWQLTTQTIIRYWDADQAKRVGHRPTAHKLSAVKKFQGPPSFRGPQPQQQDGSGKGKKKKRGSAGKGKKKKFGAVHFASAPSGPAPVAHTIAHIGPQGLYQRLEVSDPVTSSFGQGPWASFNNAMTMADSLEVPKTQRTVQRLEQSLLNRIEHAPTPESTSSVEETPIPRPATPLEYMDLEPPSVAPTPERQMTPPPTPPIRRSPAPPVTGNGGHPFRSFMAIGTNLTAEQARQRSEQPQLPIEDRVDWDDGSLFGDGGYDDAEPGSASGIYDLVDCDEWYVYSDSSSACTNGITKTVCASRRSQIVSKEDSVLLSNYLSTCSGSHCTICKGSGSNLRNPEWMLDSGALYPCLLRFHRIYAI
jgi:gag-polypeptide of LTR copia-type